MCMCVECVCECVYVCMCVCGEGGGRRGLLVTEDPKAKQKHVDLVSPCVKCCKVYAKVNVASKYTF